MAIELRVHYIMAFRQV